jgi:uncharacterized protein Usg
MLPDSLLQREVSRSPFALGEPIQPYLNAHTAAVDRSMSGPLHSVRFASSRVVHDRDLLKLRSFSRIGWIVQP